MGRWGCLFLLIGCATGSPRDPSLTDSAAPDGPTLLDLLREDGRFGRLLLALDHGGVSDILERPAATTLFAPTDEAFDAAALDDQAIVALSAPDLALQLQYHIVDGRFGAGELPTGALPSVEGTTLWVDAEPTLRVNQVEVLDDPQGAANGVVHPIEGLLTRLPVVEQLRLAGLTEFPDALERLHVPTELEALDAFTLFAPLDDGYPDVPPADPGRLVRYHVAPGALSADALPDVFDSLAMETLSAGSLHNDVALSLAFGGGGLLNDTSRLLDVELIGTDGRAHLIDEAVSPLTMLEFLEVRRFSGLLDLVDRSGPLTDLRDPPRVASPSDVLRTEVFGSLTLFAPITSAFSEASDIDKTEDATQRLARHIVAGAVPRLFEEAQPTLVALTGQLALSRDPDTVSLRFGTTAQVSRTNIGCTNGLVHVIDTVLEPSE